LIGYHTIRLGRPILPVISTAAILAATTLEITAVVVVVVVTIATSTSSRLLRFSGSLSLPRWLGSWYGVFIRGCMFRIEGRMKEVVIASSE
jgi:hypothetical protein